MQGLRTLITRRAGALLAGAAALALAGGCAVEWQNTRPAQEMAERARPPGATYAGWRVFQDKCSVCHGPAATGSDRAPNLLLAVREMGPRRFAALVLDRYEWDLTRAPAGPAREAQLDELLQRRAGVVKMPAWQDEPSVSAHIIDLYAWLSARAEGRLGPGRPAPGS